MRLRHIEVFHAVYNRGSITGAAKLLNASQPSISKVLAHPSSNWASPCLTGTRVRSYRAVPGDHPAVFQPFEKAMSAFLQLPLEC
jgi:hypothetical protein